MHLKFGDDQEGLFEIINGKVQRFLISHSIFRNIFFQLRIYTIVISTKKIPVNHDRDSIIILEILSSRNRFIHQVSRLT